MVSTFEEQVKTRSETNSKHVGVKARFPFVSLYLNIQADQHGRDNFEWFVRKEFKTKAKFFAPESLECRRPVCRP